MCTPSTKFSPCLSKDTPSSMSRVSSPSIVIINLSRKSFLVPKTIFSSAASRAWSITFCGNSSSRLYERIIDNSSVSKSPSSPKISITLPSGALFLGKAQTSQTTLSPPFAPRVEEGFIKIVGCFELSG